MTVRLGDHILQLPVVEPLRGGEVLLSIRPETLFLKKGATGNAETLSLKEGATETLSLKESITETRSLDEGATGVALKGQVVHAEFLGHLMRYTVRIDGQEWLVDQPDPGRGSLSEGDVTVVVNPRRVHVIPEPQV